ncbi:CLIP domain-containing serine protease 2-like [Thrips palmi]|uniref:CLIP domain-containing serine protease 2-like n=1 Tax=Thrips palmi TaxID=161013 RepID=A0A6P8ZRM4_THRPL|nr:CLIP domain-containing serine protease 2-like [Thrips palmi]
MATLRGAWAVAALTLLFVASASAKIEGTPCYDVAAGVNGTCAVHCSWAQGSAQVCGYLNTQPIVCCPSPSVLEEPEEETDDATGRSLVTSQGLSLLPLTSCGRNPTALITNGIEAQLGDFPWLALIKIYLNPQQYVVCGGSLISSRYVLTAAHCFDEETSARRVKVLLGEHRRSVDPDCDDNDVCAEKTQVFTAEKIIIHRQYSKSTFKNDIALIRLKKEVTFTMWVKPICLPVSTKTADMNLNGKYLLAAGWGTTTFKGSTSDVKQWVVLPAVSLDSCRKTNPNVTPKQLCAGGGFEHKDTCQGDSGGPLMGIVGRNRKRLLALGIVSYGKGCGDPGVPGVYTRVGHYIPWILAHLER